MTTPEEKKVCCEKCFHPSIDGYQTYCKNVQCDCHTPTPPSVAEEDWQERERKEWLEYCSEGMGKSLTRMEAADYWLAIVDKVAKREYNRGYENGQKSVQQDS